MGKKEAVAKKVDEELEVGATEFDLEESTAIFHMKDAGMKGTGWIELRILPLEEQMELRKQCTKVKTKFVRVEGFSRPHKDVDEEFDGIAHRKLFWARAMVNWGNILDKRKNEIPFTPENIEVLMQVPRFAAFANESYLMMEKEAVEGKKEEAGN